MFFVIAKLFEIAFQPVNCFVIVTLVGLALCATPLARLGRIIVAGAIVIFAIVCFSPFSTLILRVLEDRFPPPPITMAAPTGIIVLGGSLEPDVSLARGQPTITQAAGRLTAGVALARQFPSARLVFTGGSGNVIRDRLDEAGGVRRLWLSLGVPGSQMVFEDKSRNTYENATFTRALVHPKPGETWLLVTSAAHMPRSVGIFRKDGWSIVPYPVDYRTFGDGRDLKLDTVGLGSLEKLNIAGHEWFGLVVYRLTDKTDALFPSP